MTLPAAMIARGFWLYVWRITSPVGELLYVGRTGDNSSPNAGAPFTRMGQHLGSNKFQNMVRQHLEKRGTSPEECDNFELIAYGPIFSEAPNKDWDVHVERRNVVAALERALAEGLADAGYDVLNTVKVKHDLDTDLWSIVSKAFAVHFRRLEAAAKQ